MIKEKDISLLVFFKPSSFLKTLFKRLKLFVFKRFRFARQQLCPPYFKARVLDRLQEQNISHFL